MIHPLLSLALLALAILIVALGCHSDRRRQQILDAWYRDLQAEDTHAHAHQEKDAA